MPDPRTTLALARLEFRSALRNWWLLLYGAVFVVLAGGVAYLSAGDTADLERGEFGRTAAALTNVVMLVAPLFGLIAGAASIAGDRERGVLAYYLAQPIRAADLFWGKYVGGLAALATAMAAGFAAAAFALAGNGALEAPDFLWLILTSGLLLGIAYSLGVLISTLSRRSALALAAAVVLWVGLLFIGDLGLMGTAMATNLRLDVVVGLALCNPAEVFKIATVHEIDASLDALGPAGAYLIDEIGRGLTPLLLALLAAWTVAPTIVALMRFSRSDAY